VRRPATSRESESPRGEERAQNPQVFHTLECTVLLAVFRALRRLDRDRQRGHASSASSAVVRERRRDVPRKGGRVGGQDVRHDGHDDPAFAKRHQRHHPPAQRLAVVAGRLRCFTGQRYGLEVPAKTVTGPLPRGQSLRRLEQLRRGRLQQRAAVDRQTEADQVGRGGEERHGSRVAGQVVRAHHVRAVPGLRAELREVERRATRGQRRVNDDSFSKAERRSHERLCKPSILRRIGRVVQSS